MQCAKCGGPVPMDGTSGIVNDEWVCQACLKTIMAKAWAGDTDWIPPAELDASYEAYQKQAERRSKR